MQQGGDELLVESGGVVTVESGGVVTVESGGILTLESGAAIDQQAGSKVGAISGATMVVGAEGTNAINVTIQLTDALGADLAVVGYVQAFLSDATTGIGLGGTAPNTSVAIGTDGAIIAELVTKQAWLLQSEADGDIDLTITETGIDTWYLVVILPNGLQIVSGAITFA